MILVDNRNNTDPYINLALEEYLVRNADCSKSDYLFLYRNKPCVVVGKNQSVYKEINFKHLRNSSLKICRRISGGGTVYHDLGNLCFAFISKFADNKINNYRFFNQPVADALKKIGINSELDLRNNMLFREKKFSGSAQFTNRRNIISHGTILFDADLKILREALKENDFSIQTKAISSVPNSVINLGQYSSCNDIEELKDFLVSELIDQGSLTFTGTEWQTITDLAETKYRTWEWIFGRSPTTTIEKNGIKVEIEAGQIVNISGAKDPDLLIGCRYDYHEIKKALGNTSNAQAVLNAVL